MYRRESALDGTHIVAEAFKVVGGRASLDLVLEARNHILGFFGEKINDYAQMTRDEYGERLSSYREAAIEALESLDATDDSASAPTNEPESEAAGSDPLASDTDSVEEDEYTPPESEESVGTDESAESGESSSNDGSDVEEPSEDTALGEYD